MDGTEPGAITSEDHDRTDNDGRILMTTPAGGSLNTDFELMAAVAGKTDARNEEIRAMLQSFIGRMTSVPPSVWGGVAAARFRDVVDRWNAESVKLHAALARIGETLRANEQTLRAATETHSHQIGAVGTNL
jgi:ESAT-6 family protein